MECANIDFKEFCRSFMENDFIFRRVREHDAADLALLEAFFDQMGGETRAFFNHGDWNRKFMRASMAGTSDEVSVHWIAEADGRVAGYVFLTFVDTGIPWLGIAIAEEMKGRHLGRRLIALAKDWAKENGKGGVMLTTHVANIRGQRLYENCGFQRLGIHVSGEVLYYWRM